MQILKQLFKRTKIETLVSNEIDPDVLVKQIHDEVDSLEEDSIKAVQELLDSIQIPTEDKVVNKANLMKSLGFGNANEIIKQGASTIQRIKESTELKEITKKKLELINQYRLTYPNDKIIPFSEFNKVLEKYNLIYAPSKAYIKDVPEKNLLEIQNAKRTEDDHKIRDHYLVTKVELDWDSTTDQLNKVAAYLRDNPILLAPEARHEKARESYIDYGISSLSALDRKMDSFETKTRDTYIKVWKEPSNYIIMEKIFNSIAHLGIKDKYTIKGSLSVVPRSGLFIAAPKSHFDTDALNTSDGKEYFFKQEIKVTKQEIKDPIAFDMLKGVENDEEYFVRIKSKWGTSDDKSYLDPIVQDERLN